jgi:hypothetical protein
MPTRDEFDEAQALFDETIALYEASKAEFEIVQAKIRGRFRTNVDYEALELVQRKLFRARARLMRLHRERDRRARPQ